MVDANGRKAGCRAPGNPGREHPARYHLVQLPIGERTQGEAVAVVLPALSMRARRRSRFRSASSAVVVTLLAALAANEPVSAGATGLTLERPAVAEAAQAAPSPLVRVAYSFVHDSGGGQPSAGAEVTLLFAADGEAFVYAADATEAFADDGSFTYGEGKLSLHFATADLKVDATFPLSLAARQVTMPFQVLSAKSGTSLWEQQSLALDQGVFAVYNAAVNTGAGLTAAQGALTADAYARAWLSAAAPVGAGAQVRRLSGRQAAGQPTGQCTEQGNYCIVSTQNLGDDLEIFYKNAPPVLIDLYSFGISSPSTPLTLSSLASDPRVFLDPTIHPDSQFNPPVKKAVFIVPVPSLETPSALADMVSTLRGRSYGVSELDGPAASVDGIVTALKADPGMVIFSTHGDKAGDVLTGDSVPVANIDPATVTQAQQKFVTKLSNEGLKALATYRLNGTPSFILGDPNCSLRIFPWPASSCQWKVAITPAFWNWLETQDGVSFDHSLVFMSACETDATPTLRDQIKAGAYFAFSKDVWTRFSTVIEQYLVEALSRPTHSAEEAFYNMLRVEKTHQMIYKEDRLFQGYLGALGSDASTAILNAYGWNGTVLVSYRGNGWTSGEVDAGQVWWMLYAARWLKDTTDGAAALNHCLDTYWLRGLPGGLADQYCNAANAGIPKNTSGLTKDVAYAIYLLNGTPPPGFPRNQLPPRWTLDD